MNKERPLKRFIVSEAVDYVVEGYDDEDAMRRFLDAIGVTGRNAKHVKNTTVHDRSVREDGA